MTKVLSETKLIVGLGNPGRQYEGTRHNLGFIVVKKLAVDYQLKFGLSSFSNGVTVDGEIDGINVCLLLPLTYMNKSGVAVRQVVDHKELDLDNVLVVCDDMNLDFEQIRLRPSGSHGGNNGLKSIEQQMQTKDFARLRLGIGKPRHQREDVDYVLSRFSQEEQKNLEDFADRATQCCVVWLKDGIAKAMDQFNKRKENGKD